MKTADFDFDLPPDRIAEHPAKPRDAARLLDVAERLHDRIVRDLPALLEPGDLMVVNDTRVIPARLDGRRGEVRVEITLHKREGEREWATFARPGKRLKPGDVIAIAEDFSAEVVAKDGMEVRLRFSKGGPELMEALHRHGRMPLPPYIRREADEQDAADYQTVFAAREGAVAAPTAGLHFTPELLAALDARGVRRVPVTLHVGAGTFLPVKVDDIAEHRMHSEWGEISPETAEAINTTRAAGGRIVSVGTTALRILETAGLDDRSIRAFSGDTDIFITPGYRFKIVDLLVTNFHLPRSTLFMLVCAFAGMDTMKAAYAHAIGQGYRFFSYGDASLLRRV
ncbi:tRNA preQ1(34) S-adenosylmethionine ribosyltransferase-isomerase QueA [Azospirillum sp. TSH58]|uniref:tRNA preQ1(34) S-adenosylmethionine ribosyltransferase-isomerase QueA n=1 Tax=Azospirillum sp. TSH58 TaxID=664962 RepID=UPI000D5FEC45|nr:tRNA preQ1(34) S-adenosylmethionine ribosyltransferase-isomerase QueA [Azospirillum sp. TSH58]AWJ83257.1 tRNA preQ1(34) S-adenosylmethionine ribosyltransferase-isomerase QueA [Azospirillum sp. TSH58]PWC80235.1 S-adenosylmethionine tRNA ribosyltransferase [Azospirillum sp. TSH58]